MIDQSSSRDEIVTQRWIGENDRWTTRKRGRGHKRARMLFNVMFVVLCLLCAALYYLQNKGGASSGHSPTTSDFKKFQRSYLIVYVCAVCADWLQGPYVYALCKFELVAPYLLSQLSAYALCDQSSFHYLRTGFASASER